MEDNDVLADFQFVDSYVKNSSIEINKRDIKNSRLEVGLSIAISNISLNEKNEKIADAKLYIDVKVFDKKNEEALVKIEVEILGKFLTKKLEDKEFVEYVKFSGIPMLSQQVRAYIMSMSSLSGINSIIVPMINFESYFNNIENENN